MTNPEWQLYRDITNAFADTLSNNGRVNNGKLAHAAKMIAPLYDRFFGQGMVSNYLKDDIIGHADGLLKAIEPDPLFLYADTMVPRMLELKPIEEIRGKFGEGIVELLWTKRALEFICRFLYYCIIKYTDKTLYYCGTVAYTEVLKPYHGFLVAGIVSLAFKLAPTREKFMSSLGFCNLHDAQEILKPFLKEATEVLDKVQAILLKYDCDFPDKV